LSAQPVSQPREREALVEDARSAIVIFTLTASATIALGYLILRVGFDNPILPVLRTISLAVFVLCLPSFAQRILRHFGLQNWLLSNPILAFLSLAVVVLSGLLVERTGTSLYVFVALSSLFLVVWFIARYLRSESIRKMKMVILVGVLLGMFMAAMLWGVMPHGGIYTNPLFIENLVIGESSRDTLFHVSISNMLMTYQQPTTGLHGIPYIHYHYGSHFVIGAMAALADIDTLSFYQLGYPVILVPVFLYMFAHFGVAFRSSLYPQVSTRFIRLSNDRWFWLGLIVAMIGYVSYGTLVDVRILWERFMGSESYNVSLSAMFVLLTVAMHFVENSRTGSAFSSPLNVIAVVVVVPLLIGTIGFLKLSVMFVIMAGYTYLLLRMNWLRYPIMVLGFGIATILSLVVTGLTQVSDYASVRLFAHILDYVGTDRILVWLLLHSQWLLIYAAFRLFLLRSFKPRRIWRNIRENRLIDVELLIVIAFVGLIPGMLLRIPGSSGGYFSDIQYTLAGAMIVGTLSLAAVRIELKPTIRFIMISLLVAGIAIAVAGNLHDTFNRLVVKNLSIRSTLLGHSLPIRAIVAEVLSQRSLAPLSELSVDYQSEIETQARYQWLVALRDLNELPLGVKSQTLLYIPKSESVYWEWLPDCSAVPFVAPALTGIAMLDGLPVQGCEYRDFGYQYYDPVTETDTQLLRPGLQDQCASARRLGFNELIIITSSADTGQVVTQHHSCSVE
jgi:hypothetical protein